MLLGANLVRDESAELLSMLITRAPAEPSPDGAEDLDRPTSPATSALASPTLAEEYARAARHTSRLPEERSIRFSLSARVGGHATEETADPFFVFGAEFGFDIGTLVAVGITDLGFGGNLSSSDFAIAASGTPYLELHGFIDPRIELYGQVGVALQGRSQTAYDEGHFQVAAYLAAGARLYASNSFFIGLELAMHVVLTDAFLMGSISLPQGTTVGSAALSIGWTF
ncbi:hypothetical protein [Sandaracinus amylolyticus]|uniref:hypothetical protein n=1 Tax=Sandaracinus amylolyticus TaxID=927083 RepID=UPI001F17F5D6|nr:hypothetical protein [Sandaracinus amylolyticus]